MRALAAAALFVSLVASLLAGCGSSPPATSSISAAWPSTHAPRLGRPMAPADVARADTTVWPDGRGLPPGRGSVADGERLYQQRCQACHGRRAQGGTADELVGSGGGADPGARTLAAYWPYATTLYDFIRRAMPMNAPGSLRDDEVYALCAYLLALDGLVAPDATLDATTLAAIGMPHRRAFIGVDAPFRARSAPQN